MGRGHRKADRRALKHNGWVNAVAFSPDGKKIATASGGTARLWDAATGKPLGEPLRHDDAVNAVAFSPDGTKIATASGDTARLWDVATGKPLREPLRHDDAVDAVAFSPDGTKVATASGDTARLWDIATGKPLGEPLKHDIRVNSVAFSRDGTKVATASWDGGTWQWIVPRPVPDDPLWIDAYVRTVSQRIEDADHTLHPLSDEGAVSSWREVLKSPAWLDERTKRLEGSRRRPPRGRRRGAGNCQELVCRRLSSPLARQIGAGEYRVAEAVGQSAETSGNGPHTKYRYES